VDARVLWRKSGQMLIRLQPLLALSDLPVRVRQKAQRLGIVGIDAQRLLVHADLKPDARLLDGVVRAAVRHVGGFRF